MTLTRGPNEGVMIGDEISFKILRVVGGKVTISFCAPKGVIVDREEVYLAKLAQAAEQPPK